MTPKINWNEEQKQRRRNRNLRLRKYFSSVVLKELNRSKRKIGSWDLFAREFGLHKKTIMRWRSRRLISWGYIGFLIRKFEISQDKLIVPEHLRYCIDEDFNVLP